MIWFDKWIYAIYGQLDGTCNNVKADSIEMVSSRMKPDHMKSDIVEDAVAYEWYIWLWFILKIHTIIVETLKNYK